MHYPKLPIALETDVLEKQLGHIFSREELFPYTKNFPKFVQYVYSRIDKGDYKGIRGTKRKLVIVLWLEVARGDQWDMAYRLYARRIGYPVGNEAILKERRIGRPFQETQARLERVKLDMASAERYYKRAQEALEVAKKEAEEAIALQADLDKAFATYLL